MKKQFKLIAIIKSKFKKKSKLFYILTFLSLMGLFLGMMISLQIFNHKNRNRNQNFEISFVNPRQAVVFWTTTDKTLGYVKYGTSPKKRINKEYQTSNQPSTIHAVVLNDLPLENIYLSLHNDSDKWFFSSEVIPVVFDPKLFIE